MVRSRDDKQAYFAKLKDFIETYRELRAVWCRGCRRGLTRLL